MLLQRETPVSWDKTASLGLKAAPLPIFSGPTGSTHTVLLLEPAQSLVPPSRELASLQRLQSLQRLLQGEPTLSPQILGKEHRGTNLVIYF